MTQPAPLAFIDCETTGLDPYHHEIWEVALILRTVSDHECQRPAHADGHHDPGCHAYDVPTDAEYVWQLPVDLTHADPMALNIGRFHERRHDLGVIPTGQFAQVFAGLTRGAHLVGACVSFDAERLWRLLRANGECPMWHYHIVDTEAMVAGYLAGRHRGLSPEGPMDDRHALAAPPWDSKQLSLAVGIDPDKFDRHTALGDAQWARAIYDAVTGTQP